MRAPHFEQVAACRRSALAAAVTQVSQRHSEGRACYDKKIAEGKTAKEALRALKRQVSDILCSA
jgi:hypothetical protein